MDCSNQWLRLTLIFLVTLSIYVNAGIFLSSLFHFSPVFNQFLPKRNLRSIFFIARLWKDLVYYACLVNPQMFFSLKSDSGLTVVTVFKKKSQFPNSFSHVCHQHFVKLQRVWRTHYIYWRLCSRCSITEHLWEKRLKKLLVIIHWKKGQR